MHCVMDHVVGVMGHLVVCHGPCDGVMGHLVVCHGPCGGVMGHLVVCHGPCGGGHGPPGGMSWDM